MAYEDEVLADTPLAYWRCDEVVLTSSPVTLVDLSGNGHDLPLQYFDFNSDGYNPLGRTSPIETDAGSRAVHVEDGPFGSFLTLEDWSKGVISSASWFHLLGDVTLECWFNGGTWDHGFGITERTLFGSSFDFHLGMDGLPPWKFAGFVTLSDNSQYSVLANLTLENDT